MTNPLHPYPSPEERTRKINIIIENGCFKSTEYGQSIEGRPLKAICIDSYTKDPKRVLCTANIHGLEFISSYLAISLLEAFANKTEPAEKLRQKAEIWIVPCLNPDGHAKTWERRGIGRLVEFRTNSNGVDLNRNFPLPYGKKHTRFPGMGSPNHGAITYRGEHPLSEPETHSLNSFLKEKNFHASLGLHSFMGSVIPALVRDKGPYKQYRILANCFKKAQPNHKYFRLAARWLDVFTGELEDYLHHELNCWAVCVETFTIMSNFRQYLRAPAVFWRYNPKDPDYWAENDVQGILSYFLEALSIPRPNEFKKQ